jgi:hypothetical protein
MSKLRGGRRIQALARLMVVGAISLLAASPASASDFFVVLRAGQGCAFAVGVEPGDATPTIKELPVGAADITFTNVDTGATYLWRSRYTSSETFDPSTKSFHYVVIGNFWEGFMPGDQGPWGKVAKPGAELLFSGQLDYTRNRNDVITSFSYTGTYLDLCALLSQ